MSPTPRLTNTTTALLVVDIQERLLPAMFESDRVLQNSIRLAKGCRLLGVPAVASEQYRKGLGPTVPALAEALAGAQPFEKVVFSACSPELISGLRSKGITNLIVCGIEAHVCVLQTGLDILQTGFGVFVVADAISSRTSENYRLSMDRLRQAGAMIVSTEMVLFELLGTADRPEFKEILTLVK